MALLFSNASSSQVNHGSAATLDNRNTGTNLCWIRPSALENGDRIVYKGTAGNIHFLGINGTGGNFQFGIQGGTTMNKITNTTPVAANAWNFLAATFDFGVSGDMYHGTLSAPASLQTLGTNVNGATAGDDSGSDQLVGSNVASQFFSGDIAWVGLWNRVLTLGEIQAQQFHPRVTDSCVLFVRYGWYGTTSCPDLSGNANNGTATGCTVSTDVPLLPMYGGFAGARR